MFVRRLQACSNTQKVVVDVLEDVSLPMCISMETLKLIWAMSERGNDLGAALLKPVVGPPLQEGKDPSHLLFEEHGLLPPLGLSCISLRVRIQRS